MNMNFLAVAFKAEPELKNVFRTTCSCIYIKKNNSYLMMNQYLTTLVYFNYTDTHSVTVMDFIFMQQINISINYKSTAETILLYFYGFCLIISCTLRDFLVIKCRIIQKYCCLVIKIFNKIMKSYCFCSVFIKLIHSDYENINFIFP